MHPQDLQGGTRTFVNVLHANRHFVARALTAAQRQQPAVAGPGGFVAPYRLPEDSPRLRSFFAASTVAVRELGALPGAVGPRAWLLDLMGNPRTRTTKTFASLVIVARAVAHVRETGEPVTIVTASSGNKATALRDAVLRAYESRLATPEELSITVVLPRASEHKLWASPLSEDPALREVNPVAVLDDPSVTVKQLARDVVSDLAGPHFHETGRRLWYTLDLANYIAADAVRAVVSRAVATPGRPVTNLHAVSSAYGLLGHHFGASLLPDSDADRYFLVQHLGTPDMVLDLVYDSFERANLPAYRFDDRDGLYRQSASPHFPHEAGDVTELLEPTFYTAAPPTSPAMKQIIRTQGGGGIVVSLHECLTRYAATRAVLARAEIGLPADPRQLREWSLVMALTGADLAADRGLLPAAGADPTHRPGAGRAGVELLVHGSGSYSAADYRPLPTEHTHAVSSARELREVVQRATQRAVVPA